MKIVRHISVTDAILSSSNVVKPRPLPYNAGTTYGPAIRFPFFGGPSNTTATLCRSLQDSNTGNLRHRPRHGGSPSALPISHTAGPRPAADAIVTDTTNHKLYQSLFGSNSSNALTDTDWWRTRSVEPMGHVRHENGHANDAPALGVVNARRKRAH